MLDDIYSLEVDSHPYCNTCKHNPDNSVGILQTSDDVVLTPLQGFGMKHPKESIHTELRCSWRVILAYFHLIAEIIKSSAHVSRVLQ